jgi:uncharacterized membrane protein YhaH (DUF805 family)
MEAFNIYINAFERIKDYHNPAPRKEFYFFILFYLVFWLVIFIPMMMVVFYYGMSSMMEKNFDYLKLMIPFSLVCWIFYFVHAFPLFALIKRRLIDIIPLKANLIFGIFLTLEIIRLSISLIFPFITYSIQKTIMAGGNLPITSFLCTWILGLINNIFAMLTFVFYIFLMVKQGNIGKEEK